jgi:hypothetical protein
MGLVIAAVALLTSVIFNIIQYAWRRADKIEQKGKEEQRENEHRRKEQAPPDFYRVDGNSGPILVNGRRASTQGNFVDI